MSIFELTPLNHATYIVIKYIYLLFFISTALLKVWLRRYGDFTAKGKRKKLPRYYSYWQIVLDMLLGWMIFQSSILLLLLGYSKLSITVSSSFIFLSIMVLFSAKINNTYIILLDREMVSGKLSKKLNYFSGTIFLISLAGYIYTILYSLL